jgi:hypothetical protein
VNTPALDILRAKTANAATTAVTAAPSMGKWEKANTIANVAGVGMQALPYVMPQNDAPRKIHGQNGAGNMAPMPSN